MTEHTPGPWSWRDDINSGEWNLSPGVLITPDTDGTPGGDEIDQANAHLIAAAPELLEDAQAYREVARNAITDLYVVMMMATSHPQDIYDFALACRKSHMERLEAIDDRAAIAKAKGEK